MCKRYCIFWVVIGVIIMLSNTLGAKPVFKSSQFEKADKLAVWYSPELRILNPEEIQFRLTQPFDKSENIILKKSNRDKTFQKTITSCTELTEALEMDYEAWLSNLEQQKYLAKKNYCESLQLLKVAMRAKKSFLHAFHLRKDSLHFLPALIVPTTNKNIICGLVKKNNLGISLADSERIEAVEESPDNRILIQTASLVITVNMLAKGDFNGDGLADILLQVQSQSRVDQSRSFANYLITRTSSKNVFSVLNPRQYLPDNFSCIF